MSGEGVDMICSVRYDDGDVREDFRAYDELVIEGALQPPDTVSWNSSELEAKRCRKCAQCQAPDCGHCATCVGNRNSTTIHKDCCLFRVSYIVFAVHSGKNGPLNME